MIRSDVLQGTEEWQRLRLGIPTASQFSRVLTPTGKPSSQASAYAHELVAERILGVPVSQVERTEWMRRGTEMEARAVAWYEFERGVDTSPVGFCRTDDGRVGCSPDRLVAGGGGLEVKCPNAATHVGYLLDDVDRKYRPQVQGGLYVTGLAWWDFVSYHDELPPVVVRVHRDEEFLSALDAALTDFCARVDEYEVRVRDLVERGVAVA